MAVLFDAVAGSPLINCGSASIINNLSPFTISCWTRASSRGAGGLGRIFAKGARLAFAQSTNSIRFTVQYSLTNMIIETAANVLNTDGVTLDHYTFFYAGINSAAASAIFKNGVEVAYGLQQNGSGTENSDATTALIIGNAPGAIPNRSWQGDIEEFAIWDVELSTANILNLAGSRARYMPLQVDPSALAAYWPLDDVAEATTASGTAIFRDRSANTNHGTPSNSPSGRATRVLSYP